MKKSILIVIIFILSFSSSLAQDDAAELAKKLANPIASLISVPFQNNTDYGIGDWRGTRNTMNIQPVIPISITEDINLITRVVLPVVTQYNITAPGEKQSGLSDAVMSAFFSPANSEKLTWGVGPALLLPTGTNDFLTTKKFGMGPTAVALKQANGWTVGGLINQIWSVAGNADRPDVSQMFVQPFVVYNWKSGAGLGANMEWTQNWKASTSTVWLNPTISAVTALGKQKTQFVVGPRLNLAAPDGSKADWGWRAVVIFLFPK
ncbi:hypothetical protein PBT90_20165 [Algoriphagus halophytocola]|uniref:hypothetical protein n=1 Tax=Algoriphagus halophytocola TaxID=2991499 RepID=UPI0022DD2A05|nr:hypothetical protein [Algoriphagus sp. TR-M9]WBL43044.1 hypothetical protein PBT90_20165 [Algoriphagus sp. TR-M9]